MVAIEVALLIEMKLTYKDSTATTNRSLGYRTQKIKHLKTTLLDIGAYQSSYRPMPIRALYWCYYFSMNHGIVQGGQCRPPCKVSEFVPFSFESSEQ